MGLLGDLTRNPAMYMIFNPGSVTANIYISSEFGVYVYIYILVTGVYLRVFCGVKDRVGGVKKTRNRDRERERLRCSFSDNNHCDGITVHTAI